MSSGWLEIGLISCWKSQSDILTMTVLLLLLLLLLFCVKKRNLIKTTISCGVCNLFAHTFNNWLDATSLYFVRRAIYLMREQFIRINPAQCYPPHWNLALWCLTPLAATARCLMLSHFVELFRGIDRNRNHDYRFAPKRRNIGKVWINEKTNAT